MMEPEDEQEAQRLARAALSALPMFGAALESKPGTRPDGPAPEDAAFLIGRLLTAIELSMGGAGLHEQTTDLDGGCMSALTGMPASDSFSRAEFPQAGNWAALGWERVMRTARQLAAADADTIPVAAARVALLGVASMLTAQMELDDKDSSTEEVRESLAHAYAFLTESAKQITALHASLSPSDKPLPEV